MFSQRGGLMSRGSSIAAAAAIGFAMLACSARAETILGSDYASNYGGSNPAWANGANQSTNLGGWDLSNNNNNGSSLFSGYFLGDSTAGAGNINTSGQSFAVYANPASAYADASLGLNGQFATAGRTLRFDMAVNFDNGSKGFSLIAGNGSEILNWNLGGGAGVTSNFTLSQSSNTYDYGGNDAVLSVEMTLDSSSQLSYSISRTSSQGTQGVLFDGSVSSITSLPATMKFYNSGTDNGNAQNNLYFNSVVVSVPEPAMAPLVIFGLLVPAAVSYRRVRRRALRG
jgi:hypothetical protein